jgi:hypothetical protein
MVKIRTTEFVLEELDVEEARFFCEQPLLLSISSLSVLARLSPPVEEKNYVMECDDGGFGLFFP